MRFLPLLAVLLLLPACRQAEAPTPDGAGAAPVEAVAFTDEETVLYEVFVRNFSEEGTFAAVTARLDSLQALGVNTLWLMPIHPISEANRKGTLGSPYAIQDYKAVNPLLGTEDDFRALVDATHARGMKLIIDWVANHTGWDNAWIEEHPDYYTQNENGEIIIPRDNDGNLTDWTDTADLNYDNPATRAAMIDALTYWVREFDIDGYRCDVAGMVPNDFWADAIDSLRAIKPVFMLAEWSTGEVHAAGFDASYGWPRYARVKEVWDGEATAQSLVDLVIEEEETYPVGALRMNFTSNHDETAWDATPLELFGGPDGARAAATAMLLMPGFPLVYNGQEYADPQRIPLFEKVSVSRDQGAETVAMRQFYTDLLAFRASSAVFTQGTMASVAHDQPDAVVAYAMIHAGSTMLVLVNTRPEAITVTLEAQLAGAALRFGEVTPEASGGEGTAFTLPGHGYAVLGVGASEA
ncbi:MAG: alpha-amylase family glycosyl hydrolase [Bacteroidota bacterium]